ncbi:MAG: hypothetical protein RLZZ435_2404 [Cyanobacteriota bacterium]|jgi:hypothetical protein
MIEERLEGNSQPFCGFFIRSINFPHNPSAEDPLSGSMGTGCMCEQPAVRLGAYSPPYSTDDLKVLVQLQCRNVTLKPIHFCS